MGVLSSLRVRLLLVSLAASVVACSSNSTSQAGPSCTDVCATPQVCDGGAGASDGDCLTRCSGLQSVIDPMYWSGAVSCAATCGDESSCVAAQATRVPVSTVDDFLHQLCNWAITCQSGVTVDQCVAALQGVGDNGEESPWAVLGLLKPEKRQCLLSCFEGGSCSDFSSASDQCLDACGLTGVVGLGGSSDATECGGTCTSDCSGHGTCTFNTASCLSSCSCDAGFVEAPMLACAPDCRIGAGCGTGGTCGVDGLCTCAAGYVLGTDFACHGMAKFIAVSLSPSTVIALRDDGRLEGFGSITGGLPAQFSGAGADVVQTCVDPVAGNPLCVRQADGTVTCFNSMSSPPTLQFSTSPGSLDVACGQGFNCTIAADGSVMCQQNLSGAMPIVPPPVPASTPALAQLSALKHVCGRTAAGAVYCWGPSSVAPSVLTPPEGLVAQLVRVTDARSCAIDASGMLVCWGDHATMVPSDLGAIDRLAIYDDQACARRAADHVLECWALLSGTLTPPLDDLLHPIPALMGAQISDVFAAGLGGAFCAVLESGGFTCWGSATSILPIAAGMVQQPAVE